MLSVTQPVKMVKRQRQKTGPKDRNKLKKEKAFLYFLAYNHDERQMKKFLSELINATQYLVLRELAINELADNIPIYDSKKKKKQLKLETKTRFLKLSRGELHKSKLPHLYDFIKLLARHTIDYHDLC